MEKLKLFLKNNYVKWKHRGKYISISSSAEVSTKSKLEGYNKIHANTYFKGEMGRFSYIGANSYLNAKVGRFTSIAPYVRVLISRHPFSYPFVSTSPVFFSDKKQCNYSFVVKSLFEEQKMLSNGYAIEIGNDCWICDHVILSPNITIADGAVVLPGAVVTKDVPPYAIVGGGPAKIIKYRYSTDDIKYLCNLKWWNKPIDWLEQNHNLFIDIDALKKYANV